MAIFIPQKCSCETISRLNVKNNTFWAKNTSNVEKDCLSCGGKFMWSKFAPHGLFCSTDDVCRKYQLSCMFSWVHNWRLASRRGAQFGGKISYFPTSVKIVPTFRPSAIPTSQHFTFHILFFKTYWETLNVGKKKLLLYINHHHHLGHQHPPLLHSPQRHHCGEWCFTAWHFREQLDWKVCRQGVQAA